MTDDKIANISNMESQWEISTIGLSPDHCLDSHYSTNVLRFSMRADDRPFDNENIEKLNDPAKAHNLLFIAYYNGSIN